MTTTTDTPFTPHARKADNMSATSQRTPITVRINPEHHQQLQQIAERQDSTVSRLVARAVAERLEAINSAPASTGTAS